MAIKPKKSKLNPPPAPYTRPPAPGPSPTSPPPETGKVEPPKKPEKPADPPPKPGPEAHARASAAAAKGQEKKGDEKKPDAKPGEPPLGQTPEQAAAALVMMTEVATSLACKFYAARLKVKLTPEIVAALRLSEEERANLLTYAPYAAPFMWELLAKYGKYIGAALYGMCFYDSLITRFAALKEIAPAKEPKRKKKEAAAPEVVKANEAGGEKPGDDAKPASDFKVLG